MGVKTKKRGKITDKERLDFLSLDPGYGVVALRVWTKKEPMESPAWLPPVGGVRRAIDAAIRSSRGSK